MLTKEEKKQWLINNCLNEKGQIDLSYLDLSGYDIDTSGIIANKIWQSYQIADMIVQKGHKANDIAQHGHTVNGIVPFNLNGYKREHPLGYYIKRKLLKRDSPIRYVDTEPRNILELVLGKLNERGLI